MLKRLQDNNSIISNFVKVDLPIIVKTEPRKFGSALISYIKMLTLKM